MKHMAIMVMVILGLVLNTYAQENTRTEFVVHGVDQDAVFKLSDAKGKYVALHFLLKTACPYCMAHTITYARRAEELPDVIQVFLKPDTDEEIKNWRMSLDKKNNAVEEIALKLPVIYRDPEAELAKVFEIPFGYQFHGQEVHYPALVLIGPDGKEVFRYVGEKNSDRFEFDELIKKLTELKESK